MALDVNNVDLRSNSRKRVTEILSNIIYYNINPLSISTEGILNDGPSMNKRPYCLI